MAKKIKRGWFVDTVTSDIKLAIVEKTSRTVDGVTDEWQAVKESGLTIRMEYLGLDSDLSSLTDDYGEISDRYHKTIVDKVIAMGYRDPRNQNLQNAEYFESLYKAGLKRAKKFTKSRNITTGRIVPQDF